MLSSVSFFVFLRTGGRHRWLLWQGQKVLLAEVVPWAKAWRLKLVNYTGNRMSIKWATGERWRYKKAHGSFKAWESESWNWETKEDSKKGGRVLNRLTTKSGLGRRSVKWIWNWRRAEGWRTGWGRRAHLCAPGGHRGVRCPQIPSAEVPGSVGTGWWTRSCGELREWELRGEDSINYLLSWHEENEIDHLIHAGVCRIQEGIFKTSKEFQYERERRWTMEWCLGAAGRAPVGWRGTCTMYWGSPNTLVLPERSSSEYKTQEGKFYFCFRL